MGRRLPSGAFSAAMHALRKEARAKRQAARDAAPAEASESGTAAERSAALELERHFSKPRKRP
jgi:hypothetical protein